MRVDRETAWQRLHEVRLRGIIQAADDDEDVEALIDVGYVARRGSTITITAAGKEAHAKWARLAKGSGEEVVARRVYEQFLELDLQVKQVTTDWQMASATSKAEGYSPEEWKLVDRLVALDEKVGPPLSRLGRAVPRFATYRPRLRHALKALEDGDRKWFSGLACDSYHTVWWQLHEDLLVSLAIDRSEDPNQ